MADLRSMHPGEYLEDILDWRTQSVSDLARAIDFDAGYLLDFIAGDASLTEELAEKLATQNMLDKETWQKAQRRYDEYWAEQEELEQLRELLTHGRNPTLLLREVKTWLAKAEEASP